jgi:hypothetical protein
MKSEHGIYFENPAQQAGPSAAPFLDEFGIFIVRGGRCGTAGNIVRRSGVYS